MATSKEYTVSRKISDTEEEIIQLPYSVLADAPNLATVATSGSYNDLSDKPTIPDVSGKANRTGGNTFTGNQQFNQGGYWFATDTNHPFVVELENGDALIAVNPNGVSFDSDGLGTMPFLLNGNAGTSGQVLTSQGADATPTWTTPSAVKYTAQTLTTAQKAQARTNIGAGTGNGTVTGVKINGSTKGTSGVVDLGYTIVKVNGKTYTANTNGLIDLGTISGGGGGAETYVDYIRADDVTTIFGSSEYGNAFIFSNTDGGQGIAQTFSIYVGGIKTNILTTDYSSNYVDQIVCINISRLTSAEVGLQIDGIIVNVLYKNTVKTVYISDSSGSSVDLGYTDNENQSTSALLSITKGVV